MTVAVADVRTVEQLAEFIADGGQPKYLTFWGHRPLPDGQVGKGCFSQWWPASFTVDGETYASAEHFMMAAKALLFGDAEMAGRIRAAPHPRAAKELGRSVRGFDEQRWAERRSDLVVTGNLVSSCPAKARSRAICGAIPMRATYRSGAAVVSRAESRPILPR